jgi:hypothetical protein
MESSTRPPLAPELRVPFLLGDLKVSTAEVSPAEWIKVLDHVLDLLRRRLEHLPGFERLFAWIEASPDPANYILRRADRERVEVVGGSRDALDVECLELYRASGAPTERHLYLAKDGRWFASELHLRSYEEHGHGFRAHRVASVNQVELGRVICLTEKDLEQFFRQFPQAPRWVLFGLQLALNKTIKTRKNHLRSLIMESEQLWQIRDRFDLTADDQRPSMAL